MNNLGDQINADLTYSVEFNLAHMYHANKNYKEAIELFTGALVAIAFCCMLNDSRFFTSHLCY